MTEQEKRVCRAVLWFVIGAVFCYLLLASNGEILSLQGGM